MTQTIERTNGHQPHADGGHEYSHESTQPNAEKVTEARKQLLVKRETHKLVRQLAMRLGRSNDAVIRRAIRMLDQATKAEQVKSDDDWADEVAS